MRLFKKKETVFQKHEKELKSDLYYKVTTNNDSTFSYQKNKGLIWENKNSFYLSPGDVVVITETKHLEFEERKFLNWMHLFYIRKRSLFELLFQLVLLASYVVVYMYTIYGLVKGDTLTLAITSLFGTVVLFAPIVLLVMKTIRTLMKAITHGGPNRHLRNNFHPFESFTFKDKRGAKRTIYFDKEGKLKADNKGEYTYGDAIKINENIYQFNLLIHNKDNKPLYKTEYYTIQMDFKQNEGLLIPKNKKLEYSKIELNLPKVMTKSKK